MGAHDTKRTQSRHLHEPTKTPSLKKRPLDYLMAPGQSLTESDTRKENYAEQLALN